MINNRFNYNNLPNNGNYIFYYDPISGKLSYIFKYGSTPIYGCYIFKYSPQDDILVEDNLVYGELLGKLIRIDNNEKIIELAEISSKIDNFKRNLFRQISNVEFEIDLGLSSSFSKDIELDKLIDLRKLHSLQKVMQDRDNLLINDNKKSILLEDDVEKLISNQIKQFYTETMSNLTIKSENSISEMACNELVSRYEKLIKLDTELHLKTLTRELFFQELEKIDRENYDIFSEGFISLEDTDKTIQLEKVLEWHKKEQEVFVDSSTSLLNHKQTKATLEKEDVISQKTGKNLILDSDVASLVKDKVNTKSTQENIGILKDFKKIDNLDSDIAIHKNTKNISLEQDISSLIKDSKDIKSTQTSQLIEKDFKRVILDKEQNLSNFNKNIEIEDSELKSKLCTKLNKVELDNLLKLSEKVATSEELELINKEKKEIQEEIEEKLKLHKRFWFLKNVGQMDIKILPNRDSVYPPDISLFDESQTFFRYMYSYEDKFKDITKGIKVRLYKNIPTGIELKSSFEIGDISSDLSIEQDGIQIVISHLSVSDMDYNYRLSISVNTDRDDFDFLVIEQPQGFLGNEFVFVTSEKFLADNHPIPLGEDLGLREIPISIAIMVDFINILLLIWSKRHYAFSGYTGTQAIQGMIDLVYEWITLETSIEQEAIEEYNRCFRWFRWECEKTYNKAKLDPNLHGNRWIEEVLFEMVDYMEMHHFNEMPQWDKVEKMDEHRNIFQDIHLDIPIVLDKFKGVRKRIISPKNKR